jgi:hypothetical protein
MPLNDPTGQPIIDATIAQVTSTEGVIDSATVLINGFQAMLQAAVSQALANGATSAQLTPLTQLSADLKAKSDALAAAVAANTPAPTPGPTGVKK